MTSDMTRLLGLDPEPRATVAGWLETRARLRDSTRRAYAAHIRLHLAPHLGVVLLAELHVSHVEKVFTALLGRQGTERGDGAAGARDAPVGAERRGPRRLLADNPARYVKGCPTCSFLVDGIGNLSHLHACHTTLVLVSRAPITSIERFEKRMGWQVPWYSSAGSDFNYDFHASFDEHKAPLEYSYKDKETLQREAPYIRSGTDGPGVSVFLRDGSRVFLTYSAYERGLDSLLGTYRWLELAPLGRQRHVIEFPHHDSYDQGS